MTAPEVAVAVVTPVADHVAPAQLGSRPSSTKGFRLAQAGCVVGVAFALVSIDWGLGGTWLLDTLGGSLERQARAGHPSAGVTLLAVAAVKLVAAFLPLRALRPLTSRVWNRRVWALACTEAVVLSLYGAVFTAVGLLIQAGVIDVPVTANRRALAWHAYLWDPWFLAWGLLVGAALLRRRHDRTPILDTERTQVGPRTGRRLTA